MTKYHVVIPYDFHFNVVADSPEEAIEVAHNMEGKMGDYTEEHILVTELPFKGE